MIAHISHDTPCSAPGLYPHDTDSSLNDNQSNSIRPGNDTLATVWCHNDIGWCLPQGLSLITDISLTKGDINSKLRD